MGKFIHLHTHSHYSLLDGLTKIPDLVSRVKELGMEALALTDHGVLYGAVEFYKEAKAAGIKPILGVEAYMAPRDRFSRDAGEKYYHLILLCENDTGWKNLIRLVTKAHLEGFYYKPRADKDLLREHHEGLIALSGCIAGEVNRNLISGKFEEAKRIALEFADIFGPDNFYLEIGHHPNTKDAARIRGDIVRLSRETGIPLAATQDSHYLRPEDAEYHDVLLAVQTGSKTDDDDRLSLRADDFSLTSPEDMAEKFKDIPEAIENTARIAERCNVELRLGKAVLPDFSKPDGKTANEYIRELTHGRLEARLGARKDAEDVRQRLLYELHVIEKTGFADYFLIVADMINWAKAHGIAVGPGRGSSAGSLVSFILGITDVQPMDYGLLFERFLNPDRVQMPDVDIDFADNRRDEVLAYLQEKYGRDHVAQIITFGTMAARAGVRDAGRAMGFSYGFCDQIAKLIPFNMDIAESLEKVPELAELHAKNADAKRLLDTARHLEGVARHASVHACGAVISKEPLTHYLPLQLAPQDKVNIITQFEMHSVEDLGLLKIDLLGLRNLTIIEETLRLIKETRGDAIAISEILLNDKRTFDLLRAGDTTGVFQLEGAGMRRYLKDLKPTEFEDIVAMISLYRPGTLDAGMVPRYIARKHGKEPVVYLHPKLEPILKTTYGIGVYQEQMMQITRDLAGFSFAEADTMRRAIGKKIKSLLNEQKEKLINGMLKNGIPPRIAQEIWGLFPPFARYGFNRSHAVCYALIGYRTAWLKTHYREEFMAALFNAELNDVERISVLIQEAKQAGLEILPPDIHASFVSFTPEGKKIRFGLLGIKNVGSEIAKGIIEERTRGGPFASFEDFLARVQHKDLNKKSLESLIKGGVFDSLGIERNQALHNLDDIVRFASSARKDSAAGGRSSSLFGASTPKFSLRLESTRPATDEEKLAWEKELLGFYLSEHPLNAYAEKIKELKAHTIDAARAQKDGKTVRTAGLVSRVQKIITRNGDPMIFAKIEGTSSQSLEVLVFNNTLAKTASVWQENAVVLIDGRMTWRDGEPKMICENAKKLEA